MNLNLFGMPKKLFEYAGISALVLIFVAFLFAAVSSLPPEPTPESVEMGSLR